MRCDGILIIIYYKFTPESAGEECWKSVKNWLSYCMSLVPSGFWNTV